MLEEEKRFINYLGDFFGNDIGRYSIVLFTKVDDLENEDYGLDEYIGSDKSRALSEIINRCNGNFCSVSNRWDLFDSHMTVLRFNLATMIGQIIFSNDHSFYPSTRSDRTF